MNNVKAIREHLGITQQTLATALGCTYGNIGFYEAGQTFPPKSAQALIDLAAQFGYRLDFNHVYGNAPLPKAKRMRRKVNQPGDKDAPPGSDS